MNLRTSPPVRSTKNRPRELIAVAGWNGKALVLFDGVDLGQDGGGVYILGVCGFDRLGELQQLGALGERVGLELTLLLELREERRVRGRLQVAAVFARLLACLEDC